VDIILPVVLSSTCFFLYLAVDIDDMDINLPDGDDEDEEGGGARQVRKA